MCSGLVKYISLEIGRSEIEIMDAIDANRICIYEPLRGNCCENNCLNDFGKDENVSLRNALASEFRISLGESQKSNNNGLLLKYEDKLIYIDKEFLSKKYTITVDEYKLAVCLKIIGSILWSFGEVNVNLLKKVDCVEINDSFFVGNDNYSFVLCVNNESLGNYEYDESMFREFLVGIGTEIYDIALNGEFSRLGYFESFSLKLFLEDEQVL